MFRCSNYISKCLNVNSTITCDSEACLLSGLSDDVMKG